MEACPRKYWRRLVSIPRPANAYPVEWRSSVDVDREWQPGSLASPFYHASNAHPAEGLPPFIDEEVGAPDPVSLLLAV
jgi:hypothetical protein